MTGRHPLAGSVGFYLAGQLVHLPTDLRAIRNATLSRRMIRLRANELRTIAMPARLATRIHMKVHDKSVKKQSETDRMSSEMTESQESMRRGTLVPKQLFELRQAAKQFEVIVPADVIEVVPACGDGLLQCRQGQIAFCSSRISESRRCLFCTHASNPAKNCSRVITLICRATIPNNSCSLAKYFGIGLFASIDDSHGHRTWQFGTT